MAFLGFAAKLAKQRAEDILKKKMGIGSAIGDIGKFAGNVAGDIGGAVSNIGETAQKGFDTFQNFRKQISNPFGDPFETEPADSTKKPGAFDKLGAAARGFQRFRQSLIDPYQQERMELLRQLLKDKTEKKDGRV